MREWLVTNGLGGYASLTSSNDNTRKFHGLLIPSLQPPAKRWLFVNNIFESITIDNQHYDLRGLGNFNFNLFPVTNYHVNGVEIKKTVLMQHEKNTTILQYQIKTKKPISLKLTPIINSRHFYDVTEKNSINFKQNQQKNGVIIKPNNVDKQLKIIIEKSQYEHNKSWMQLQYKKDEQRRDSWIEHAYKTGDFYVNVQNNCIFYVILTIEDEQDFNAETIFNEEIKRKKQLLKKANLPNIFDKMVLGANDYIVQTQHGKSIIAGYHWFGVWGRDTLIALPGLTLITQRYDLAKEILFSMKAYQKNGLIPNAVMDRDSVPVYNTVDASLWYIDRVYQYMRYTDDHEFLGEIWDTLNAVINGYKKGTDYEIHMDEDYLISHGPGLTWMDVKLGDYYPTPRSKKAVEIQALWYNALQIMSTLADNSGRENVYSELAANIKESFTNQYTDYYDVIDNQDTAFRLNQIFLASLDFTMIDTKQQQTIIKNVEKKLVTPFGLRTLSQDNENYKGYYIGDYDRDLTYHNGIVWPWPLGSFIKAFVKVHNYQQKWRNYAFITFLKPMLDVYGDKWDGHIHEIFDGEPPYAPRGCIAQAWSVAEILRSWVEDIKGIPPKFEYVKITT